MTKLLGSPSRSKYAVNVCVTGSKRFSPFCVPIQMIPEESMQIAVTLSLLRLPSVPGRFR